MSGPGPADIIAFWKEAGPDRWFKKSEAFDQDIRARFGRFHAEAAAGAHDGWAGTADGALALVLVLDQFSRNLHRGGDPRAFAQDRHALRIAEGAMRRGLDLEIGEAHGWSMQQFLYMPLMHAESLACQQRCLALFAANADDEGIRFARIHRDIIRDFGRFPHRNEALGRKTTAAEQAFLDGDGFKG